MPSLTDVLLPVKKRSNYPLNQVRRLSMAPGVGYPVLVEEVLPGDVYSVDTESLIKTYPLLAPLLGSFEMRFDFFFIPTRLYQQEMDTNRVMFKPSDTIFPRMIMPQNNIAEANASYDVLGDGRLSPKASVHKSSLFEHLGAAAGAISIGDGTGAASRYLTAVSLIGYYDIFRNYYANTQEGFMYIFDGTEPQSGSSFPGLKRVSLASIDALIQDCLTTPGVDITGHHYANSVGSDWYPWKTAHLSEQGGLWLCSYKSDMLTAYLSQATYTDMVTSSNINVESGQVTVNQIRFASHLMEYFERGLVAGGRYDDWVEAQYGVKCNRDLCIPEFLGRISSSVVFQDVVSTSNSQAPDSTAETGLGDLGGRGHGYVRGRKIRFSAEENGYFMCIATLVPRVSYCEGVAPYLFKSDLMDVHSPQLERIGFQLLPEGYATYQPQYTYQLDSSGKPVSANFNFRNRMGSGYGFQPAWTEYRTALDRSCGEFGNHGDLAYWVLNRHFSGVYKQSGESAPTPLYASYENYSSYVFPHLFTYPFADQNVNAENFLVQVAFDVKAGRPVGKMVMPTL